MTINNYNNIGIAIIALIAVLDKSKELSISKICLIFPLLSHRELLQYLARKTTNIKSIEKLIIDRTSNFTNFNKRYYDSLPLTFNALQYLNDMDYINITIDNVSINKGFQYDKKMGKRANNIFKASENIALLLQEESAKLYLNLRVKL